MTHSDIKIIAFDADDTLWHNEQFFREAENEFAALLEDYLPQHTVLRELLKTEINNIGLYGYGIKAFMLSMVETALRISDGKLPNDAIERILHIGKLQLQKPVELLDGIERVLNEISQRFRLVLATKGDLLDQERKLRKSGLEKYFHHIEIMSEKKEDDYAKLIKHLDIKPSEFLMVGNSIKSDMLPVLKLGGYGIHIPYHTTWEHERVEGTVEHPHFTQVNNVAEIPALFR